MGIVKTSVFLLEAPDDTEPLNNWAGIARRNSATMDAAMAQRVTPPGIPDLNAEVAARTAADSGLSGRIAALEAWAAQSGPTEVTYGTGWAGYVDNSAGVLWNGLRYVRRFGVVTLSGAIRATAAVAANSLITTLPAGFRTAVKLESVIPAQASNVVIDVNVDGTVRMNAAQASGFVTAFPPLTFVAV